MNQCNINIDKILKTSLEHQEPSVVFDEIWDKYSKNKGPVLVYKRMIVLVAAVLVLLISTKYISNMNRLDNTVNSSQKMALRRVTNTDTTNKKQNNIDTKSNEKLALFSESVSNSHSDSAKINPKVKAFKSKELDNVQKKSATSDAKLPIKMAKVNDKVADVSNEMAEIPLAVTDASIGIAKVPSIVTSPSIAMAKMATPVTNSSMASFVIWDNRHYYRTVTIVEQKDLGKRLGKIIKQTTKPQHNWEGNEFPVGTMLYAVSGEDSKAVIAIRLGDIYYRAVAKP